MRQIIATLVLAASVLGLAACSNGGGSNFVPSTQSTNHVKPQFGWPYG